MTPFQPTGNLAQAICKFMPTCKTINRFGRAERHGERFVAQTPKLYRHSDCYVAYTDADDEESFGVIHHFIQMVDGGVSNLAVVVAPFCCEEDRYGMCLQPDIDEDTCSHISAVRPQRWETIDLGCTYFIKQKNLLLGLFKVLWIVMHVK